MAEVQTRDILLRVGGRTLQRFGVLCCNGAGRAIPELVETFTRASVRRFRDQDGNGRTAAVNKVAIEYPGELSGLVDQFGYRYGGPRLNGARTQLVTNPENFGLWTVQGVVGISGGQADPFGGTGAYLLDSNTPINSDGIWEVVTFAGDATKATIGFVRTFSGAPAGFNLYDATAGVSRAWVRVTWSTGDPATAVPTLSFDTGGGTLFPPVPMAGGWWLIGFAASGVIAANSNRLYRYADLSGTGSANYFFGANTWNAPFPSSYQGPGEAAGAADSLIVPFNFGPVDTTILYRLARPVWADVAGDIGAFPSLCNVSTAAPRYELYCDQTTRTFAARSNTSASQATATIPAGAELQFISQHKNAGTLPAVAVDVGSGLTAFDTGAPLFTAFSNQTLQVGVNAPLYGVVLDLVIARGLFTRQELLAVP